MASNYNINDMVNYLNQYNQQQNVPQYQVTPEQIRAYQDMFALREQQLKTQQSQAKLLKEAQLQDQKINAINNLATQLKGIDTRPPAASFNLYNWRGNATDKINIDGRQPFSDNIKQVENPQRIDTNTQLAKAQIDLQEQQQAQQLANAQEMVKFQEAVALANQYNIPIGLAMGLTGKDILGFEKDRTTAQAGITKEQIGSTGDLFNTVLKGQQDMQLEEFKANNDLNLQQNKYLNEGLLQIQKGNIDKGLEEIKQAGLNKRQEAELLNRMNIAKTQANATMNAAATRAAATRYAADQRIQGQPSFGPVSAAMQNIMFYPEEYQRKILGDYDTYATMTGLRGGQIPQVNPRNVNTMNNYINNQDASLGW